MFDTEPQDDKATSKFMGVCSTIANKYALDVFLVRLIVVLLAVFTAFFPVFLVYVILGMFASESE